MIIFVLLPLDERGRDDFAALYRRYRDGMVRLANHYVHSRDTAQDVVQTAFYNIMRSADRFRAVDEEKQQAYIAATVRNAALDQLRRRKVILIGGDSLSWVVQPQYHTEYDYIDSLCSLSEICKDAVMMRYTFKLTDKEIGLRMGIKPKTVQKRISRGIQALREDGGRGQAHEKPG